LPSVEKNTQQMSSLPSIKNTWHISSLPSVKNKTLGKVFLCRVFFT
jgi:hypothetical protein